MSRFKSIGAVGVAITAIGAGVLFDSYKKSQEPSPFHLAYQDMSKINVIPIKYTLEEQEEALLKIFYLAGYLDLRTIWRDINKMSSVKNPEALYTNIVHALKKSGALEKDHDSFSPKILRKSLFKGSEFDKQDAADWMLYLSQHAFARSANQERNELSKKPWMEEYKAEYFESAKILGLTDRVEPTSFEYDEAWIAGASRVGFLARTYDLFSLIDKDLFSVKGGIYALAGQRPLWAEIDGIQPTYLKSLEDLISSRGNIDDMPTLANDTSPDRVTNGKLYMHQLADSYGVKLNKDQPFIVYASNPPKGLVVGRTYPNYSKGEERKLDETLMSLDVLEKLETIFAGKVHIVDTIKYSDGKRPDTSSTVRDAAKRLLSSLKESEREGSFMVVLESNNPYIERQALQAQLEINKLLEEMSLSKVKINVHGIGFSNKQTVPVVHSELGALLSVKYNSAKFESKRDTKTLLFQTRDNSHSEDIDARIPEIVTSPLLGSLDALFDYYMD
jgi:hypothetical protein